MKDTTRVAVPVAGEVEQEELDHRRRQQGGAEPPFGPPAGPGCGDHGDTGQAGPDEGEQALKHHRRQERPDLERHVEEMVGHARKDTVQRHEAEEAERTPPELVRRIDDVGRAPPGRGQGARLPAPSRPG